MTDTKFVALFDLHVGYDVWETANGFERRPAHDPGMIKLAKSFIKEFEPNVLIFGGDQSHGASISHWNKDKAIHHIENNYTNDLDELRDKALVPLVESCPSNARAIWIEGNHDAWINDFKRKYPQMHKLIDPHAYLGVSGPNGKRNGWEFVEQGGYYKLGKLFFLHGDKICASKNGSVLHTKTAVYEWNRSLRYGHFHTYQCSSKASPNDERDRHTAISVPCMAARAASYLSGSPNSCIQGFLYGYVSKTGNFSDYVVVVANKSVVIEGKVYSK